MMNLFHRILRKKWRRVVEASINNTYRVQFRLYRECCNSTPFFGGGRRKNSQNINKRPMTRLSGYMSECRGNIRDRRQAI